MTNATKVVTLSPVVLGCSLLILQKSIRSEVLQFSGLIHALLDYPFLALSFLFTFRTQRRKLH